MADNQKDVALKIAVQTSGTEQVNALAKQIDALAKGGGAAAPEFQRLADEMRKLGEQDKTVAELARLEGEVSATSKSLDEARSKFGTLKTTLDEQSKSTQALREQQVAARNALEQTSTQVRETKAQLDLLKASSDGSAKSTQEYKTQAIELATQLARLKAIQADQRTELTSANTALRASEVALRDAAKAYDGAAAGASSLGKTLREQKADVDQARIAMTRSGVTASELGTAQSEVGQAFDRTRTAIVQQIEAQERAAATANTLAKAERELQAELQFEAETAQRAAAAEAEVVAVGMRNSQIKRDLLAGEQRAAREAQAALQEAFGVVGVRSAQQIEAELVQVRTALNTIRDSGTLTGTGLAQAMSAGEQRVKSLERELRAAHGQLSLMDRAAGALNTTIGQFTAGALFANVIQTAAYQVMTLGKEAIDANVKLQQMELGLKSVYGSSAAASDQIEFLRNTAQKAGVSVSDISGAFIKFAASAQSANIPMSTTNGLFSALTKSAATLGLSGDKVADMLNALGQMAGKGVVQMEELRGQLGDSLPGALPKVAKGLGITVAEMEKLARNGELLASEVFPALQRVLEEGGGEVDTISAKWSRFKNVMTETGQTIGQSAIGQALGAAFAGVGRVVEHLAFTVALLGEGFTTLGKRIGVAMADIAGQGLKFRGFSDEAKKAFQEIDDESDDKMTKLAARIEGIEVPANKATASMTKSAQTAGQMITLVGDKIVYVSDQVNATTPGVQKNADAHNTAAGAATQNASAQAKAGNAVANAGQQAAAAHPTWTNLTVAYSKVNEELEQQVKVASATVAAKKAEGDEAQHLANLSVNETTQRAAASAAALENAKAHGTLTQALTTELGVLRAQRDAEIALYNASTTKEEAQRKQIEALSKTIEVKTQELEKNREITESLKDEATARQIAVESVKDNSNRLYELRAAYITSKDALDKLTQAQKEGKATTEQVADGKRKAAVAEQLYTDSLRDQINKINETAKAQQARFGLEEANIRLAIEEARTAGDVAKAKGDVKGAIEAANYVRQLEIELLRLQAQAQRAEAEAILAALPAKRAELELAGKLTEAMKKSLEAEELSAKAKVKQSEITDELANRIGRVASATEEAGHKARDSAGGFDGMSDSMDRASDSADRLSNGLGRIKSYRGTTYGDGEAPVMGADGKPVPGVVQRTVMGMDQDAISNLRQKRDLGLLSSSDTGTAESAYMAATANLQSLQSINQAFVSQAAIDEAQARARDSKEILDHLRTMEKGGGIQGASQPSSGDAPGSLQSTTHTVNITLGGQTTSVNTASPADSQTLTNMLQQLGSASQRATT